MKKCPAFTIALSSSLILLLTACKSTGSFQVQTNEAFVSGSNPTLLGPSVPLPEVSVTGQVFPSTSNALVGDTSYSQVTNLLGVANIYDPEVPAFWNHQLPSSLTAVQTTTLAVLTATGSSMVSSKFG
jgi:hypothetical protein